MIGHPKMMLEMMFNHPHLESPFTTTSPVLEALIEGISNSEHIKSTDDGDDDQYYSRKRGMGSMRNPVDLVLELMMVEVVTALESEGQDDAVTLIKEHFNLHM
jgi:hypothetical protein